MRRLILLLAISCIASYQSITAATTNPIGYINLTVPAGSQAIPKYKTLNLALQAESEMNSRIISLTSNTITIAETPSFAIDSSNPYFLKFTSGDEAGRYALITSASGAELTLDTQGADLIGLTISTGASSGDLVEIIQADTLDTTFTGLALGGTSAPVSDEIWLWSAVSGQYAKYYYHSGNARWQDTVFGIPSNNTVIWPNAGVMYVRRGTTELSFDVVGTVPVNPTKIQIRESGFTFISGGYPANTSLLNLGLHNNPSWVAGTSANLSDQAWIWNPISGQFAKYYFHSDNSRWQDTIFGLSADNTTIPAGSMIMIKRAQVSGTDFVSIDTEIPYNL